MQTWRWSPIQNHHESLELLFKIIRKQLSYVMCHHMKKGFINILIFSVIQREIHPLIFGIRWNWVLSLQEASKQALWLAGSPGKCQAMEELHSEYSFWCWRFLSRIFLKVELLQLNLNLKKLRQLSSEAFILFVSWSIPEYNSYCLLLASNTGWHLGSFLDKKNGVYSRVTLQMHFSPCNFLWSWEGKQSEIPVWILHVLLCLQWWCSWIVASLTAFPLPQC